MLQLDVMIRDDTHEVLSRARRRGRKAGPLTRRVVLEAAIMKILIAAALVLASISGAQAKGCIKGAIVGGIAGHAAGRH
jgi:hypothetical protein